MKIKKDFGNFKNKKNKKILECRNKNISKKQKRSSLGFNLTPFFGLGSESRHHGIISGLFSVKTFLM